MLHLPFGGSPPLWPFLKMVDRRGFEPLGSQYVRIRIQSARNRPELNPFSFDEVVCLCSSQNTQLS
jgi:hypothetical protein